MADTSAKVTKLVGAPGSGKTYQLLQHARAEKTQNDVGVDDMLFLTFSNAASRETEDRLKEIYPNAEEETVEDRVRTIHSMALSLCLREGEIDLGDDARHDLITEETNGDVYRYFFAQEHPDIGYDPGASRNSIADLREGKTDIPLGNKLIALHSYINASAWDVEEHPAAPFDLPLSDERIAEVLDDWRRFKRESGLIEHDDYVRRAADAGLYPDARVLYVDEFQDLSPIQYKLYKVWRDAPGVERCYIGGDANQSIYGFRGVEPMYFEETPADETERKRESHRCRQEIIDFAREVADSAENDVCDVSAKQEGGDVWRHSMSSESEFTAYVEALYERHGDVMILARANHQLYDVARALGDRGLPYSDLRPDGYFNTWLRELWEPYRALSELRERDSAEPRVVESLMSLIGAGDVTDAGEEVIRDARDSQATLDSRADEFGSRISRDRAMSWFDGVDEVSEIVERLKLKGWQRGDLKEALDNDVSPPPGDVRLGTMHSAKGLESPCVVLLPEYSASQMDRYKEQRHEEKRVLYVAATRAEEELVIAEDVVSGEVAPPLQ